MGNRYHSRFWSLFLRTWPNLFSIYFHQFLCRWIWLESFISIGILFIRYVICRIFTSLYWQGRRQIWTSKNDNHHTNAPWIYLYLDEFCRTPTHAICGIFLLKTYGTRLHELVALNFGRSMVLSPSRKGPKHYGSGRSNWFSFFPTF